MDEESFRKYIEFANQHETITLILQELAYKKVAVHVMRKGVPLHEYTVFIDDLGKVVAVKPGTIEPEFTAQVEEEHLLDMIENHEEIKKSPGLAIGYFNKVKMPLSVRMRIMGVAMSNGFV
jgi:hypothetical protein